MSLGDITDQASLILSALALMVSLVTTYRSEMRATEERDRAVRGQLTDVLERLMSSNLENAKLFREAGRSDPLYYQAASSALLQRNGFLLNQATYLSDRIPHLVSAVELNTIAFTSANAGNLAVAESYYVRAIGAAPSDFQRALAIRSYANFLFGMTRTQEARESFKKAIGLLKGRDTLTKQTNGFTYQQWALAERLAGTSADRVDALFDEARKEYAAIESEYLRAQALELLAAAQLGVGGPAPTGPAPTGPGTPEPPR
jgi:tetratricopeptide (TPR) repeat protein